MGRLNKTQDGFSVVEGLLVVIILCLVGFVGWYVIHANKTSSSTNAPANNTSTTAKATPQADPYKGWAVASSSKLSVSFKYPSDWKSSIPDGTATCSGVILANVEPSAGDLSSAATIVNPLLKSYRINITQFGAQSSKCAADGI